MPRLKSVPRAPFHHFLTHDEVTEYLSRLAAARPHLCRLESLGSSRQGRPVHLLTVTDFRSGSPEDKPAYLIHGNIHAGEVAGCHAALYTARQLLADEPDLLQRVAFHIVPQLNPDGAELVVTTAGRVRSRTETSEKTPNSLYQEDVDGDGLSLTMRQQHSDGAFVKDPADRRLMIRRKFDSKGPFYRVLPEGYIHQWDGGEEIREGGRRFDWNRNWSYDWRPEPEQGGAGDFPFSEMEMQHLAHFLHDRPNLFGALGYHTGPAAVLRPPSTGQDTDLDEGDVQVMRELADIAAGETGFPVIPVIEYHTERSRDIELRGHFHNFGYHHLGLYVFEFELGMIQNSAGVTTREQLGVVTEEDSEAQMRRVLTWWDGQKSRQPLFKPWKKVAHPQLGAVEIGGFLIPHLINPTLADLRKIARGTYNFTLEHARRHPSIALEDLCVDRVAAGLFRIRGRVANRGAFPTHVTCKGARLRRLRSVRAAFHPAPGVQLVSQQAHFDLGHLAGVSGSRRLEWFVAGKGDELGEIRVQGGTGGNACHSVTAT